MANQVEEAKEALKANIDHFTDVTIPDLETYIKQESNLRKLQRARSRIEVVNNVITNQANFAEMHQEGVEDVNEARNEAIEQINSFRANRVPNIRNYIKRENNTQKLQEIVDQLNTLWDKTNPADVPGGSL